MTAKELREKRFELAKEIRRLAELVNKENRDFSSEEKEAWEKVNADYNVLTRQIEVTERQERVDADQAQRAVNNPHGLGRGDLDPGRSDDDDEPAEPTYRGAAAAAVPDHIRERALRAWMRAQMDLEVTPEQHAAAKRCGISPWQRSLNIRLDATREYRRRQEIMRWAVSSRGGRLSVHPEIEARALGVGSGAIGGVLVPEGFVPRLEKAMLLFGGMLRTSEVLRTDGGGDLPWPTVDDTSNSGVLIAENTQVTEQDVAFGETILQAFKYTSRLVRVGQELMEDSAVNISDVLGDLLGERLGRILNAQFTTGTGAAQPRGIEVAAAIGVTTAPAASLDADDIIDMVHSVDPAWRPEAEWMMHDSILAAVRKFKDSNGQYLWATSLQVGDPDRLHGFPIQINQNLDSAVATGNDVAIFGALRQYKVRMVRGIRLRHLVERYADFDQDGFVAFVRADGDLVDPGADAVKKLRIG